MIKITSTIAKPILILFSIFCFFFFGSYALLNRQSFYLDFYNCEALEKRSKTKLNNIFQYLGPEKSIFNTLSRISWDKGCCEIIEKNMIFAIKSNPYDLHAKLTYSKYLVRELNDYKKAKKLLDEILSINNEYREALLLQMELMIRSNSKGAEEYYHQLNFEQYGDLKELLFYLIWSDTNYMTKALNLNSEKEKRIENIYLQINYNRENLLEKIEHYEIHKKFSFDDLVFYKRKVLWPFFQNIMKIHIINLSFDDMMIYYGFKNSWKYSKHESVEKINCLGLQELELVFEIYGGYLESSEKLSFNKKLEESFIELGCID